MNNSADEISYIIHSMVVFFFGSVTAYIIIPSVHSKFPKRVGAFGRNKYLLLLKCSAYLINALEHIVIGFDYLVFTVSAHCLDKRGCRGVNDNSSNRPVPCEPFKLGIVFLVS